MPSICMPWNTYYIYSDQLSKNEGWHVLMRNESQKPGALSLSNPDSVPSLFLHLSGPMTNLHLRPSFLQRAIPRSQRSDWTAAGGPRLCHPSEAMPRGEKRSNKATQHVTAAYSMSVERAWSPLSIQPWVLSFLWPHLLCSRLGMCPVLCHIPIVQHREGIQQMSVEWAHNSFGTEHILPGTFIFLAGIHLISSTRSWALWGQGQDQGRIQADLTVGSQGFYWTHLQLLLPFLWEY